MSFLNLVVVIGDGVGRFVGICKILFCKLDKCSLRSCNALVNFMPHPRGGWGNTGDLTNRGIKFPTTGEKSAVKSPPP